MFRRRTLLTAAVAVPTAALVTGTRAAAAPAGAAGRFPTEFPLPNGFQPEGIATGPGAVAYFGSRVDGRVFRVDLRTGEGADFSPAVGHPTLGLKTDRHNRLFAAGGTGGNGRVIDTRTGAVLVTYPFATGTTFVNDVVLTPDAAWFTDSRNPALYKVSLRHGRLPDDFTALPLSGDWMQGEGNNANGIARTPDGRALLVVQSNVGLLHRVDTGTGVTSRVDLGDVVLTNGDGLLLDGRTLFVVQNRLNQVAVLRLNSSGTRGRLVETRTDPRFDVPTTVAAFGDRLYLPNARFTTTPTPDTPYNVVAIPR
ncbi:MAG TPA: superoxide dismutase [Actinophytocola sp.]|uniref:superoxide dismutase n=1 Tax=Actinophytocola sp. TaxID=1872138 RepID=UPI002DDD43BE|nr:superoxide dismutase [Actinophytocola sp.]HEV2783928.1 superoxide dismutase [Actinophytocola sp.]